MRSASVPLSSWLSKDGVGTGSCNYLKESIGGHTNDFADVLKNVRDPGARALANGVMTNIPVRMI